MEFFMEKFVERQNIARFTTLLMTETDTGKRELLQQAFDRRNGKTSWPQRRPLNPRIELHPGPASSPSPKLGPFFLEQVGSSLV